MNFVVGFRIDIQSLWAFEPVSRGNKPIDDANETNTAKDHDRPVHVINFNWVCGWKEKQDAREDEPGKSNPSQWNSPTSQGKRSVSGERIAHPCDTNENWNRVRHLVTDRCDRSDGKESSACVRRCKVQQQQEDVHNQHESHCTNRRFGVFRKIPENG